jgi:mannose-6-phosphate isomerase-like protein (cupin superfamily)
MAEVFNFKSLPKKYDYLAPDTSEIRLLSELQWGGLAHCILRPGKISTAVKHKTVNEIWYCLSGNGEIWQQNNGLGDVKKFTSGDSFTIPVGNSFQFRNIGQEPLCILIATMPKWPGKEEAIIVRNYWNLASS